MLVAALKNLKIVKGSFLDQSRLSELLQYLLQHDIITGVIPDESQLGKVLQTAERERPCFFARTQQRSETWDLGQTAI